MTQRTRKTDNKQSEKLSDQVEKKVTQKKKEPDKKSGFTPYEGNLEKTVSTGSTLLDLSISGGRIKGGGIPAGIVVEIFGRSSSGKTVLLSEIAGAVQRQKGEVMFHDPEARLNAQFASIFGLEIESANYARPDKVPEIFKPIFTWEPKNKKVINGIFADSLAALSTDIEMDKEEGDKMGMKRAKEFSEWLRKSCRLLANNDYLMICSNQVRQTGNTFGPKYESPGGEAIGFYSTIRLKTELQKKIVAEETVYHKKEKRVVGIIIEVEVFKNSTWKPFRTAPVYIYYDYGIDNIRANLQYIKDHSDKSYYTLGGEKLHSRQPISMEKAIEEVEKQELEDQLKEEVIKIWEDVEDKFKIDRKPKKR